MKIKNRAFFRRLVLFFQTHRTLIVFTGLFLLGVWIGVWVFGRFGAMTDLFTQEDSAAITRSVGEALRFVFSSAFSGWLLLLFLYIMGLSPCGIPTSAVVSLFYGMGVGLSLSQTYTEGFVGVLFAAILIVPHTVLCAAALLIGCCETVRMSSLVGRQFFQTETHGGMASDFRLYSLRFLILACVVLLSAVLDFVLRLLFYPLF